MKLSVTFLGSNDALPDYDNDTVSFIINQRLLVDTGWCSVHNLKRSGFDPLAIEHLVFTHFHQDHYLSLPSLLFYWVMNKKNLSELRIIGPAEDVQKVVKSAMDFLQLEKDFSAYSQPEVIPVNPGDVYEQDGFTLFVGESRHTTPARCYRYADKLSGKQVAFTGDTSWHPPVIELAKGSDLLIHEASLGAQEVKPDNPSLHSSAMDAARVAVDAGVERLCLVHARTSYIEESLGSARRIFSKDVLWPEPGQVIEV